MKKAILNIFLLVLWFSLSVKAQEINDFSTNGKPVYHVKTGIIKKSEKGIFTASMDGSVKCFTLQGKLIWKADTKGGFLFDMSVGDINNDGIDEVIVASGDGTLSAFNSQGKSLWTLVRTLPFYQVCIARQKNGATKILAGGVSKVLYSLSPKGEILDSLATTDVIRNLRVGNIMNDGIVYAAMSTTVTGNNGSPTLFLINPAVGLKIIWEKGPSDLSKLSSESGNNKVYKRFLNMMVADINNDGFDEILLSNDSRTNGQLDVYNKNGEHLFMAKDKKFPNISYRMNLLNYIKLPNDEYILGHFGNKLFIYEPNGKYREVIAGPYSYASSYYDYELKTLFMGSDVAGGDEIVAYQLDKKDWKKKFETQKSIGKLNEIENNLKIMRKQISEFKKPEYQPDVKKVDVIAAEEPDGKNFKSISFAVNINLTQKIENPDELWCKVVDKRYPYKSTADELVNLVAKYESEGKNVVIWAGHGSAFYFPVSTFERMIKVAPNHLLGFVFAEMEGTDERYQEVVEKLLLPVAELCKENKKLIIFRNKNVFWNGNCYLPFWSKVLLNDKFKDVFIPGLEETNCRSQELSVAGRIGLWQTNCFDRWACRTVTDNANFDRMFEWGGQQVITPFLRNEVSAASMGATLFFTDIHAGDNNPVLYEQLVPFYEMLEKGIIQIPTKDQLLSMSDLALEIKTPPAKSFIQHGSNGHNYNYSTTANPEMVFDRLDAYWGGTCLAPYDFSYYAMNVKLRVTNFLPETPYGLVPIIPYKNRINPRIKNVLTTDGQFFYDESGKKFTATEYKPVVEKALAKSAEQMPIIVKGDVNWSAVKLDAKHIRITLVDPGYLDPGNRNTEIVLQHVNAVSCTNILSQELLPIKNSKISVTVPAGIFQIIDITIQ